MSQQTVNFGGTSVAEPPAPVLPMADESVAGDNRRKLMIVVAALGVLVLGIVAFFLLRGGSSATGSDSNGFVPPHRTHTGSSPVSTASHPVTLPRHVAAPVGRDPFKALYVAPVAAPAGSTSKSTSSAGGGSTSTTSSSSGSTSTTSTGSSSSPSTTTYHPVWVELRSVTSTTATFDIGYSNGKTLRAVRYRNVKAPAAGSRTAFAGTFALLSVRSGSAVVQYGDGTPMRLDMTHNFMVVD